MIRIRVNNSRECDLLQEYLIKSGYEWNSGTSLSDKLIVDVFNVFPGLISVHNEEGVITYYEYVFDYQYIEFAVYYETVIVMPKLKEFLSV